MAVLQLSVAPPRVPPLQAPQQCLLFQQLHSCSHRLHQDLQVPAATEQTSFWIEREGKDIQKAKESSECQVQLAELDAGHRQPGVGHDLWRGLPDCLPPCHLLWQSSFLYPWDCS